MSYLSQHCQYCGKQAFFTCGDCMVAAYCSKQHQSDHWRLGHREHCSVLKSYRLRTQENQLNIKRLQLRKKFFDNFSHKVFDNCIKIAEDLVQLQNGYIQYTREIFNELQYGISICLLARSWLIVKNEAKAIIIINNYLEEKMHFLNDMRDIINFQAFIKKQNKVNNELIMREENAIENPQNAAPNPNNTQVRQNLKTSYSIMKEFSIKKVSLLASVANILYAVKLPVIKMYEIYTQHIEKMFGRESYEASNCYFMIGSHYMENHQYYKSIACFMRAAELRGNMAGDCYYNLGIIYQLLYKYKISLMMFENAAKLRENQFGENSSEVADVYHNIAIIYQNLGNFKGAIENLQKIALIYSKDKSSQQYKDTKQSIKSLQEAFKKHMQKINEKSSGAQIIKDLKKTLRKANKIAEEQMMSQRSIRSKSDKQKQGELDKQAIENNYLKLTDEFLDRLNPLQSMYLSELQIELGQCQTIFMAATAVGSSTFLKALKITKLQHLMKDNESLFKHISIQKLSRRNQKDRRLEEGFK